MCRNPFMVCSICSQSYHSCERPTFSQQETKAFVRFFHIVTRSDGVSGLLWHFGSEKTEKGLILNGR